MTMSYQQPPHTNNSYQNMSSHGRGGAGNIVEASKSPRLQAADLETPILKTPMVSTGRGGTGNMAKNNDAKETRLRQDVEAISRIHSPSVQHAGRGGAGNIFKEGDDEKEDKDKARDKHQTALK